MRWQIAGRGLIAAMLGLAWATLLPRAIGQVTAADEAAKDADRAERLAQRNRLWQAARQHAAAGDLAAAVAEAQQMVAIEIELLGEVNGEVAYSYGWIGDQQVAAEEYAAAVASYDKQVAVLGALPDAAPWQLADARRAAMDARLWSGLDAAARRQLAEAEALNREVIAKYQAGEYAAAIVAAEQSFKLRRGVLGDEHPDTATALNNLAGLYEAMGEYARALPLYEQALAIRTKVFGEEHPDTADSLNNLASLYESMGEYARPLPLYEQALAIRQKVLGAEHPDTAASLNNLAFLYKSLGEHARALPLYEQALAIRQKVLGTEHPDTATSLNNLAVLYKSLGEYARALPLYEQALAIRTEVLGAEHPDAANSLNNLASLYESMGEYARALPLYEQALAIRQKVLGAEHRDTAASLNNLAGLYESMGDYARALPLYEQALAIRQKVLGAEHPDTATSLNDLAFLYKSMGEYARALPLYGQALAIDRKIFGDEHTATATSINNLAGLYESMGEYARALPLYEQALAINQKVLGAEHPDTAGSLNNLGGLYASMGEYARAMPLYEQALAIKRKVFGDDHPDTATALNNLAFLHKSIGEYARALPLFEQALAINQKVLGDEHPDTVTSLNNLAVVCAARGDSSRAWELLLAGAAAEEGSLQRQLFAFGDARVRSLLATAAPSVDLLASLPLTAAGQDEQLLEVLLTSKAVAFEVLNLRRAAADLAATDEKASELQRDLATAREALETLALHPPREATPEQVARQRAALQEDIGRLDEALSRKLAAFLGTDVSLAVSVDQLCAAIAPGSAHLEYFRYRPFDYHATGAAPRWLPARYAAFVIAPGAETPVRLVDLGLAAEIDGGIDRLAEHVTEYKRVAGQFADEADFEEEYREVSAALSARLFAPVAAALGDARQVTIGPDGRLHEIAFEALVDDSGKYLLEAGYSIAYVNSGRDLLRARGELGSGVAVFAGPDYAASYQDRLAAAAALDGTDMLAANGSLVTAGAAPRDDRLSRAADTRRGWRDLGESALAEGQEAAAALAKAGWGPVATYVRGQALEEMVKRLVSPRVLVLITHGDFLQNEPAPTPAVARTRSFLDTADDRGGAGLARGGLRAVEDPFLRSYLVLAGANAIDEQIPEAVHVENGWLTAREIAELDLRGTDLVVLSACSTSRGDANNGQAVMGMRSAFLFAGARTIVGSLFEVPNAETRQLLRPFYAGVAAGQGKLAALNAAKLQFIRERRETEGAAHPFYWASFILVGEP